MFKKFILFFKYFVFLSLLIHIYYLFSKNFVKRYFWILFTLIIILNDFIRRKKLSLDSNIYSYSLLTEMIMAVIIRYLLMHSNEKDSAELTDNKISLICGQRGKCYVTGKELEVDTMECHHKKPKRLGGSDEYKNLVWLSYEVHKLVHCKVEKTIKKYLEVVELDEKGLKKLNSLRKQVGKSEIIL